MKFNPEYAFPHPVLGIRDDIAGSAAAEILYDEASDPDHYILTLQYQLDNPDLAVLLVEGKAEFVCELSCTGTLFRKSEPFSGYTQTIKVPKDSVRDEVELLFL